MLLIVNPTSGSGAALRNLHLIRTELQRLLVPFAEHFTSAPGDATKAVAKAIKSGENCVVAIGGDGTLNEVVAGYFDGGESPLNPEATIGLIPSGTGSDFARTIGLHSLAESVSRLARGEVRVVDVAVIKLIGNDGNVVSRYLVNAASFGFGGETVARVNAWRNRLPHWIDGRTRFVVAALGALKNYHNRPATLLLDEARKLEVTSALIVVANGKFAGSGMKLAPNAELDDGLLDVLLTDRVSRAGIIRELLRVWDGTHLRNQRVAVWKARSVKISSNPEMLIELDGECAGSTPASIKILPASVRLVV